MAPRLKSTISRVSEPFVNGTILGRSANLWIGAIAALYNTAVAFHVNGFDPTGEQNATVNVLILAFVMLFANARESAVDRLRVPGGRRSIDPPASDPNASPPVP